MKILPISNIYNTQKFKPSFKEASEAGDLDFENYVRTDSYVDETGLHYVRNRVPYPWAEQINEVFKEKPLNTRKTQSKNIFLTQKLYEEQKRANGEMLYLRSREPIKNALYNINVDELENLLSNLDYQKRSAVTKQPFFVLGLADIPINDSNKKFIQKVLNELDIYDVNLADEHGITLLEKVINSENEMFLDKLVKTTQRVFRTDFAYDKMQKYAFDNIQNPEFKEKCMSLPIFFPDILDDIEKKDLLLLDKHVQEQMSCGFCDIDHFIKTAHRHTEKYDDKFYRYYLTESDYQKSYAKIVLDIIKKHFPKEVEKHLRHVIL